MRWQRVCIHLPTTLLCTTVVCGGEVLTCVGNIRVKIYHTTVYHTSVGRRCRVLEI